MQTRRKHLRTARRAQNLTALELAEQIGATENIIYFGERGRSTPHKETALRWAAALDLPADEAFPELFGGVSQ